MSARIDSRWTRDIENVDAFRKSLFNDTLVLGQLRKILQSEYDALIRSEESEAQFDNVNWNLFASYRNGRKAELRQILTLLDFKE